MKLKELRIFLLCAVLVVAGCGTEKKKINNTDLVPSVSSQSESTTTDSGENQQGARVEMVTKDHKMERVIFSGGYLHSLPEDVPETIVREVPKGSQGMIYGKRVINGKEWAKVTTRDGVTGWYTAPQSNKQKETKSRLEESDKTYRSMYPRVTGGTTVFVQDTINKELERYLAVYRFVTGPVGNDLKCQVTYNRKGILSLVFSGPPIKYRSYNVSQVNDIENWREVQRYAFLSPLWGSADASVLTAAVTDIRYAMTFDLKTGRRMTIFDFIGTQHNDDLRDLLSTLGEETLLERDNFFVNDKGQLFLMASQLQPEPGRVVLNLSQFVVRDY
jgi:hypothetical protein